MVRIQVPQQRRAVSNPPFKLDFSDFRNDLDNKSNYERFFAGIPNIPNKKKESMAIYLLFIQHILFSLNDNGRASVVVPTGFLTAQNGIERKIKERLIEKKMLRGVISMPSNIFATTGTNVSIIFIDKNQSSEKIVLMDASKLGTEVKEGKNQKTILSAEEEDKIISTFNNLEAVEDFTVLVTSEQIVEKKYSFSAGQYFDLKVEYEDITPNEFDSKISNHLATLDQLYKQSKNLEDKITSNLKKLTYDI